MVHLIVAAANLIALHWMVRLALGAESKVQRVVALCVGVANLFCVIWVGFEIV